MIPLGLYEPVAGGDPIGPKSCCDFVEVVVGRGAEVGKGPGDEVLLGFGRDS